MRPITIGLAFIAAILSPALPASADQGPSPALFRALATADGRLAAIGYRLVTANVALCRERQPALGVSLQALDQYAGANWSAADGVYRFETMVQVDAVVPGGPAARAGVAAGDSIVAVDGRALPPKPSTPDRAGTPASREQAETLLAAKSPTAPIRLTLRRDGRDREAIVLPIPACRTALELTLNGRFQADSDGVRLQVDGRFFDRFDDDQIAVVMAHELAHTILRHRARLDAAGIDRGLLKEVGRSGRLWRLTEDQADQLSVSLLYNAGYDPMSAATFWRGPGAEIDGGLLRARTHRSAGERAQRVAAEAASIPPNAPRPYLPPVLAERDRPIS